MKEKEMKIEKEAKVVWLNIHERAYILSLMRGTIHKDDRLNSLKFKIIDKIRDKEGSQ